MLHLSLIHIWPKGAAEYIEAEVKVVVTKDEWKGIAVYVDHVDGDIHPVTYELIGKARELADVIHQPVYALFMGSNIAESAKKKMCIRDSHMDEREIVAANLSHEI